MVTYGLKISDPVFAVLKFGNCKLLLLLKLYGTSLSRWQICFLKRWIKTTLIPKNFGR